MSKYDPRMAAYEDQTRVSAIVYAVMLVIMVAFGGFVWNLYSGRDAPPYITAPASAYKEAPPLGAPNAPDAAEQRAFPDAPAAAASAEPNSSAPQQAAEAAPGAPPQLGADPRFVSNGPYVAQLAALQSEEAVEAAWRRLASRAPDLFGAARMDIERADLGARGVFFRVRAGYFADRANANLFCERVERMGQDCIVAAR